LRPKSIRLGGRGSPAAKTKEQKIKMLSDLLRDELCWSQLLRLVCLLIAIGIPTQAHPVSTGGAGQFVCLTSRGEKDLFEAIKQKDSERVRALLAAGVNPNARSEINFEVWESTRKTCASALMQATLQGDLKTAQVLLAAKADVNASDSVERYIWAYAVGYQNIKRIPADRRQDEMNARLQITNALLAAGAQPDSQDPAEFADWWRETALFHAATAGLMTGDLRILKMIIAAGASVKDPAILPYATRTAQREAWGGGPKAPGAAAVIETLLAAGVNVNGQNLGMSALMMEAYGWELEGTVDRAKVLLAAGADVNAQNDRTGETALLIALNRGQFSGEPSPADQAAAKSRVDLVKLFLAAGADPNKRDKEGDSSLPASFDSCWLAYYAKENEVIFKALLAAGADVNSRNKDGRTILALASASGVCDYKARGTRLQLLGTLLALGADVNAQDTEKKSPLLMSIEWGLGINDDLFSTLIAAGADVNLVDKDGETPLMGATGFTISRGTYGGSASLAQLLIKVGAKVNAKNVNGDTALTMAARVAREESVTPILIAAGADVNVKNNAGDTALLVNVKAGGDAKTVQGLIAAGAEVNVTDRAGDTALIMAARLYGSRGDPRGRYAQAAMLPVISALIDGGADVKTLGADGESALTIMVTYSGPDSLPIIRQLITAGQRDGSHGYPRVTDLMASIRRAAGRSSSDIVRELIAANVDVNGVDKRGTPALIAAVRESGNVAVVRALLQGGAHVNARDTGGDTALIAAIREYLPGGEAFIKNALHRDAEVIRALLTAGADPRTRGKDGETALELAKKGGNQSVIRLLKEE
jgi:ankyrin repeat protein